MKSKIEISSVISLDEIKHQLIEQVSFKDLVTFVIDISDNMTYGPEYLISLRDKLNKMNLE